MTIDLRSLFRDGLVGFGIGLVVALGLGYGAALLG